MVAALVSLNIAIDAGAVAVCCSIPSVTQNTSAATTATRRPGLMTRAQQIRRLRVAGDTIFSLYSAVSAGRGDLLRDWRGRRAGGRNRRQRWGGGRDRRWRGGCRRRRQRHGGSIGGRARNHCGQGGG